MELTSCVPEVSSSFLMTSYDLIFHNFKSSMGQVTQSVFPPVQTGPGAEPFSCSMGTGSFQGVSAVGSCC